jgi:iron complex transport system substrate-binding protein
MLILIVGWSVLPLVADDTYPKTLTDMAGRTVTIDKPIERIITNNPDNSRIVIALGDGPLLVASDECTVETGGCVCPMKTDNETICDACWKGVTPVGLDNLPVTNTRYTMNQEQMASLKPDLILMSSEKEADEVQEHVGAPVFVASTDYTIEGMKKHITAVGEVLGKETAASDLNSFIDSEVKKVTDISSTIPEGEKLKVYYATRGAAKGFYDAKEGRDFTRTDNKYDPLTIAGGINVAKDAADGNVNVGIEQIIAWNPDVILVASSTPEDSGIDFILEAPELQSIKAVKEGRVYNTFYPNCRGTPHDRNLINMFYLGKLLYPDKFKDINLESEGNEIMKKFLGVDGVFTEYMNYLSFPVTQKI